MANSREAGSRHHYLQGLFPSEFLQRLREMPESLTPESASKNMLATRYFFRDEVLGKEIVSYLPQELGITRVVSYMRFIRYPLGGYIAPHTDGIHVDEETGASSTTSFLLYLASIPEGEGGETEILNCLPSDGPDEPQVIDTITPIDGAILLMPHGTPHQGACVGSYPKFLLRGDMY